MKLKCACCGFKQEFENAEEAFKKGWDCPPYFSGYVACNLCPGTFVIFGEQHRHTEAHERWEKEGRPKEFEASDMEWGV